jgi:hypothetical protein
MDQNRVVRTKAATELKDVAHHAPRHRTRGFKLDIIEAHLMKPTGGKNAASAGPSPRVPTSQIETTWEKAISRERLRTSPSPQIVNRGSRGSWVGSDMPEPLMTAKTGKAKSGFCPSLWNRR